MKKRLRNNVHSTELIFATSEPNERTNRRFILAWNHSELDGGSLSNNRIDENEPLMNSMTGVPVQGLDPNQFGSLDDGQ